MTFVRISEQLLFGLGLDDLLLGGGESLVQGVGSGKSLSEIFTIWTWESVESISLFNANVCVNGEISLLLDIWFLI